MNILLLEPNYKNKYPPLALMKISAFHKQRGDVVSFCKGKDVSLKDKHWDRIYITTLFTFEWMKVKEILAFAKRLVTQPDKIFIGGIAATLLPDLLRREEPNINIVCGLLNEPGKLGLEGDYIIDSLPPDYSILDKMKYTYPVHNAYFCYTTRGCGMNCSFCAVQTLEPEYVPYVSITNQINTVKELYGEKKNLMIMDNNVLKSPRMDQIVSDIISLGFGRGATYVNPKTGKTNKRTVDFNQGLDANFLTEEKARLLSLLAIEPVRIAFDHINQKDKYIAAIKTCFRAGLRSFSNYLLYNTDDHANWKGVGYEADTPENLYHRLKINLNLREELQQELDNNNVLERVFVYSFPMRYIPLNNTSRGYVGTYWNKKYLRAIQLFLNPTQGKGIASRSFFNAAFGANVEDFNRALCMPEQLIYLRGKFVTQKNATAADNNQRKMQHEISEEAIQEWSNYHKYFVDTNRWEPFFNRFVSDNHFRLEILEKIDDLEMKKMYFFYLPFDYFKNHFHELSFESRKLYDQFSERTAPAFKKIFNTHIPREK